MGRSASHYETVSRRDLSPRQREVLALIAAGRTNGEIAEHLGITLDGAKWHVSEILSKLGVNSREEAAQWWHASGGFGERVATWARGLLPGLWWKVGIPVAGVGAAAVALLLVLGGDDSPLPGGPDEPDPELAPCAMDDVIFEPVEAATEPNTAAIAVITGRSRDGDCVLTGRIAATLESGTGTAFDDFKDAQIDVVLGSQRTSLVQVNWTEACGAIPPNRYLHASFVSSAIPAPAPIGPLFLVGRPPCLDPAGAEAAPKIVYNVLPGPLSSFLPDLGPDPLDFVYCYPSDPAELRRWQRACDAADRLHSPGIIAGSVKELLSLVETRAFVCPVDGAPAPQRICEGAGSGETRQGVPAWSRGPRGEAITIDQLESNLRAMFDSAKDGPLYRTRIATVACLDAECARFALGIANDGTPPALYFVFEPRGGGSAIVTVGLAVEDAVIFRRGGEIRIGIGVDETAEVSFVPIVPPY